MVSRFLWWSLEHCQEADSMLSSSFQSNLFIPFSSFSNMQQTVKYAVLLMSDKQNKKHYQWRGGVGISPQWNEFIMSSFAVLWLLVCLQQSNTSFTFFRVSMWKKIYIKRKYSFRHKPISFSNIILKFSYLIGVTFEWNQLTCLTLSHPNLQKVTQK